MSLKILIIIIIIIGLIYNYFNKKEFFSCNDCEKCYDTTVNVKNQVITNNKHDPVGNIDINGRLISDKLCFKSTVNPNNKGEITKLGSVTNINKIKSYFGELKNRGQIPNENILTNSIGNKPVIQITGFVKKKIIIKVPYFINNNIYFRDQEFTVDDETKIKFRIYGGTNFKKGDLIFIVCKLSGNKPGICFFKVRNVNYMGSIANQYDTFDMNLAKRNVTSNPSYNNINTSTYKTVNESTISLINNQHQGSDGMGNVTKEKVEPIGSNKYIYTSSNGHKPDINIESINNELHFNIEGGSRFSPGEYLIFYDDSNPQYLSLIKIDKTRVCINKVDIKTIKDAPHFDPKSLRINNTELIESDFNNLLIIDDIIKSDYVVPSKKNMHFALPRAHKERNFAQGAGLVYKTGNIGYDSQGNRLVGQAKNDPAEYHCSGEHGKCKCPKNGHIRYIDWHHNRWTRKVAHPSGETWCNNSYFGDPSWGHYKHCYCTPGVPEDPSKTNIRLYQVVSR